MFRRVLIANRGEIAVRVIRACRDLGVSPVTVHSEADRGALPVRLADASVCLGPAPAAESYLDGERVLEAAQSLEADAVHPGYGFLAENADFAAACAARGLVFVGPSPAAMRLMGDKAEARAAAIRSGVPVAPGSAVLGEADDPRAAAAEVGFPLLIKAAAGGGGMGMRAVREPADFDRALADARSEAEAAFGDGRVFLERLVERPRHVEVQVFGDSGGAVVHLGERECSIQRRNQKLIEESPSPAVDARLRSELGAAAVRLAEQAGYEGAGTVEFLLDPDGRYYFLEMNARLQVEHPVTEALTGLDLVTLQLEVAAGAPLGFSQEEVCLSGAALELRITAEDPFAGFLPASGRIGYFRAPAGPGVRCDSGIASGSSVPPDYDSLLAKVIASGPDRETARRRALRAVRETRLVGVPTTLPFFDRVLESGVFRRGALDTSFVADHWPGLAAAPDESREALLPFALAAAAAELAGAPPPAPVPSAARSRWRDADRPGAGPFR